MNRASGLAPMSAKRRAALVEAGNPQPFSTLTVRSTLARTAGISPTVGLDRKPTGKPARPADTGPTPVTVALVCERDRGCCVRCGLRLRGERGLDWSVQHRRARGSGGTRRPDTNQAHNLILLCGSATSPGGCHLWVESHRTDADRERGWAIRLNDDPAALLVDHHLHGRVWLTPDGSWTHQAPAVAS